MKNILLVFILCALFGDCASYLNKRRRDFQDVFTIGIEYPGVGAGVRVGPVSAGLIFQGGESEPGKKDRGSGIGLRGGRIGKYHSQQLMFTILGGESFYSGELKTDSNDVPELEKGIPVLLSARDNLKSHKVRYLTFFNDPISNRKKRKRDAIVRKITEDLAEGNSDPAIKAYLPKDIPKPYGYPASYLFQIEVYAAVGAGVRLGVNFAELLDFILGFTTLDILDDDLDN
ncbi:MAG: hypothetical protein K8R21_01855 [Leptospira sp.]|nr:hypothetical protein [Leptospira sp.]